MAFLQSGQANPNIDLSFAMFPLGAIVLGHREFSPDETHDWFPVTVLYFDWRKYRSCGV